LSFCGQRGIEFPEELTSLRELDLSGNQLTNITILGRATNVVELRLGENLLTRLQFQQPLLALQVLDLSGNLLTNLVLPPQCDRLESLHVEGNRLSTLNLPAGMGRLTELGLAGNRLRSLVLGDGMARLPALELSNVGVPNPEQSLSSLSLGAGMSSLASVDLSWHKLSALNLPPGLTSLRSLRLAGNPLTTLTLPDDVVSLQSLNVRFTELTRLESSARLENLTSLEIAGTRITELSLAGLTSLESLDARFVPLRSISFLAGMASVQRVGLSEGGGLRGEIKLPTGLHRLASLDLSYNQITNVVLPEDLTNLVELNLRFNRLSTLRLPSGLIHLQNLQLDLNGLHELDVPADMTGLSVLSLGANPIIDFAFLNRLPALTELYLENYPFTVLSLPSGLANLQVLDVSYSQGLSRFTVPPGFRSLRFLDVSGCRMSQLEVVEPLLALQTLWAGWNALANQEFLKKMPNLTYLSLHNNGLTRLALPATLTKLTKLDLTGNNLTLLVLPPSVAAIQIREINPGLLRTFSAAEGSAFNFSDPRPLGTTVYRYPLTPRVTSPRRSNARGFEFTVTGPPGVYKILSATEVGSWSELARLTNELGYAVFADRAASNFAHRFFQAAAP
jgi:Leucine-rich repeat (LRR) protein